MLGVDRNTEISLSEILLCPGLLCLNNCSASEQPAAANAAVKKICVFPSVRWRINLRKSKKQLNDNLKKENPDSTSFRL